MRLLSEVEERLNKVVYFEPALERGGRPMDGVQVLLEDARWLLGQLKAAYVEIERLSPKEVA